MANAFKLKTDTAVGTSAATIYTCPSSTETTIIGLAIANIVSSLFGGMAGCALVGQSVMNTENGGKSRLSTLSSGLSLLILS